VRAESTAVKPNDCDRVSARIGVHNADGNVFDAKRLKDLVLVLASIGKIHSTITEKNRL
jgi:hypothetical protein